MIKDLTIRRYQSHKDSHFEFSKGVNVIVGVSDSGKSSIFRAIKLLLQNRPLGLGFHSNFADKEEPTEVHLNLQNKISTKKVSRIRGEEINQYLVEGYEEPFEGFGTEVPKEVSDALNISDINCQFQMDSPFLFSETPGAVARYLNKIVSLDKIDIALQNIASKKRHNETEIKFNLGRLEEIESKIKEFPDLDYIETELIRLEQLQEDIEGYTYTKEILYNTISALDNIDQDIERIEKISKHDSKIKELCRVLSEKQSLERSYDSLYKLIKSVEEIDYNLLQNKKLLEFGSQISQLSSLAEEIKVLLYTKKLLTKTVSDLDKYDIKITNYRNFIDTEEENLRVLMGEVCPLCEQPMMRTL